jgi:molecular chaperone HtpG
MNPFLLRKPWVLYFYISILGLAPNRLVKYLAENQESDKAPLICEQLYDLAMMSHKQLSPDEMTRFVQRSNEILLMIAK